MRGIKGNLKLRRGAMFVAVFHVGLCASNRATSNPYHGVTVASHMVDRVLGSSLEFLGTKVRRSILIHTLLFTPKIT